MTFYTLHRGSMKGLTGNAAACRASQATEDQLVLPRLRPCSTGAIPIHPIFSAVVSRHCCSCCNVAYKPPQWEHKPQRSKSFLWTDLCSVCGARVYCITKCGLFPVCMVLSTTSAPVCPLLYIKSRPVLLTVCSGTMPTDLSGCSYLRCHSSLWVSYSWYSTWPTLNTAF